MTAAAAVVAFRDITRVSWSIDRIVLQELPRFYRCPPFCPAGQVCTEERAYSQAYARYGCCPPGQQLCKGVCYPPCPGGQRMEGVNCTCDCSWNPVWGTNPGCTNGMVWDPVLCACGCPTTPCPDWRMTRNAFCVCQCPPGYTDCNGHCADLNNDPLFCGSCGAAPCDPFTEMCCNGVCTNVCSSSNCGSCGRAIQAGEKCCNCTPRMLGTNTNCSDCGDVCSGGRSCVNGKCSCPSGSRECAPGKPCCPNGRDCCANGNCCPTGTKCCNNTCVNTSTDANNCGSCGNKCPTGKVCVGGSCQCPSGTQAVGTCCCAGGQGCCNGVCTSLATSQNCGACGVTCTYTDQLTGAFAGTGSCDPVTRTCHCPVGQVKVGTSAGGHDICCPSATPRLCADNKCHVTCP